MSKTNTPSFVLTLKLNTDSHDEQVLPDRFFYASRMQNTLIAFARKRLRGLRQDKRYRSLMEERLVLADADKTDAATKKAIADVNKRLSDVRAIYGLSEYQFHGWIKLQQHKYSKHIDSLTAQKIATNVWNGVEAVLFRKGKTVHFKKSVDFASLEGKNNASGIRFHKGRLSWSGLSIQPQIRKGDDYAREAMKHRVKYCRIIRRPMGIKNHWYVQLILEGIPPMRHSFLPSGRVGIDQGTSTEAVVSGNGCILTELSPERPDIQKTVRRIQRRLDRSARACDPQNFKADGTAKRRVKWHRSKAWKRDRMRLKTIYRKGADTARQSRETLADRILECLGSDVYTETMDYKALQKRAKETEISEKTGKCKRKKRFGGSIGRHAPAAFMAVIERKLGYGGKAVNYVNTWNYKASQYDHHTDTCESHDLSEREKYVDGHHVQRDLYSAFLLMCAGDPESPDRELCIESFPLFLKNMETELIRLLSENIYHPSCMGLDRFGYLITA